MLARRLQQVQSLREQLGLMMIVIDNQAARCSDPFAVHAEYHAVVVNGTTNQRPRRRSGEEEAQHDDDDDDEDGEGSERSSGWLTVRWTRDLIWKIDRKWRIFVTVVAPWYARARSPRAILVTPLGGEREMVPATRRRGSAKLASLPPTDRPAAEEPRGRRAERGEAQCRQAQGAGAVAIDLACLWYERIECERFDAMRLNGAGSKSSPAGILVLSLFTTINNYNTPSSR